MAIPKLFDRISILIILNVFLRSPFVNSELMKSDNFKRDLELDPPELDAHFRRSYGLNRVELRREESNVKNQSLEDLDEMCLIALNQSGYIDRSRASSSSSRSSRTARERNAAFVSRNIKDTLYFKVLYKCGECVPKSRSQSNAEIEELFDIFIAPGEIHFRRAVVFRSTSMDEVEFIGTVKEAYFPLEDKSWLELL